MKGGECYVCTVTPCIILYSRKTDGAVTGNIRTIHTLALISLDLNPLLRLPRDRTVPAVTPRVTNYSTCVRPIDPAAFREWVLFLPTHVIKYGSIPR